MTSEQENVIRDTINKSREIIVTLRLQIQALAAQLPESKASPPQKIPDFYICPLTGKREWIGDKKTRAKNKARFERKQKKNPG